MDEVQNFSENQENIGDSELSHSDKAVGVITEPSNTFEQTAKFSPRTIDWILPVLLLFLVIAVSNILMMNNDSIGYELKQKQLKAIEEQYDELVKKGQMTQEQADQQLENIQDGMLSSPITMIITVISIFVGGFIFFIIITGIYYLFVKFLFKGDGTFTSALVANGLTAYIGIIQILAATIFAFVFGRLMRNVSVASLMNLDATTFTGFLLDKVDILAIWAYIVLGIGLAKMFKSKETGKYIALSIGLWIVGGLIIFLLIKAVPSLSFLAGQ